MLSFYYGNYEQNGQATAPRSFLLRLVQLGDAWVLRIEKLVGIYEYTWAELMAVNALDTVERKRLRTNKL